MFENRTIIKQKTYERYLEKCIFKSMIFWAIPMSVSGFISIYLFYNFSIETYLNGFTFFIIFLLFLIFNLIKHFTRYSDFKRLYNCDLEYNMTFDDDNIFIKGIKHEHLYNYDKVIAYNVFLDYSVIYFNNNMVIWLCEDSFVKGDKNEFHKFILEKCPKVKKINYLKYKIVKSN